MIKTTSIQQKFTWVVLALSLVLVAVVSWMAHQSARELILLRSDELYRAKASGLSGELESALHQYEAMVVYLTGQPTIRRILTDHDYADFRQRKSDMDWQTFRTTYMQAMVKNYGGTVRLMYVGSQKHGENYRHNDTAYTTYDARTRVWYQSAVRSDGLAYTSYLAHSRKNIDVTISAPIYESGRLLGVAGVDLATDRLINALARAMTDSVTTPMVIDSVGRILYHPNNQFLLKHISDTTISFAPEFVSSVQSLLKTKAEKSIYESLTGANHYLYAHPIGSMGWMAVLDVKEDAILEPTNDLLKSILLIDGLVLLLIVLSAGFIVRRMIRVLVKVVERMKAIAQGNSLRGQKMEITGNDEFAELAYWFNEFADKYQKLFDQLEQRGQQIAELADQLAHSVTQLNSATVEQSSAVVETTSTVEEMYQSSVNIAETAGTVSRNAGVNQNLSRQGVDLMRALVRRIEDIEKNNQHRTHDVIQMKKKVNRINEIMSLIRSINEQTKLIAFNAALEASGAGETGKRFAVVANEIRRLADTIQESMEEIRLMTDEIQAQTQQLIKGTEENTQYITTGVQSSRDVENQFNTIFSATQTVVSSTQQIELATNQQKIANEQIVATLHDLSQAIGHVVAMSGEVGQIVKELESIAAVFKKGDLNG
ncbi:MAG: methyl-accepting chemotaxis protein [Bacteroidetes bacterium]|nr:methyl-accepting chemotaxis protein [Bacteroidota bacterium]